MTSKPTCCDACLRRGALVTMLAPRIQGMLPHSRTAGLLKLDEDDLLDAVAGKKRPQVEADLARFRPKRARDAVARSGCDAVCRHHDLYPGRLLHLEDPPHPLFVRGGLARLQELVAAPGVAIVGGRLSSEYAREVATAMGHELAAAGVTVISGLALGIDGASHRGAVAGGDAVIAVLAGGPDWVYPRKHRALYDQIVERGVIVSELWPGSRPFTWSFPARNRIMAALATAVVVVEAAEKSGSLITADFAIDLGRELAAVPGPVTARLAAGSNGLLHDGAKAVRGAADVIDLLFDVGAGPKIPEPKPEPELDPALREILDAIEVHDGLSAAARRAGLTAGGLRAALGRLEALGLVRRDGVGGYERRIAVAGRST